MRLGILADIHEEVRWLRQAVKRLKEDEADRLIILGDVCGMGERIEETIAILSESGAVGVWGNHDFGVSSSPRDSVRAFFAKGVTEFMTTLQPRLEVEDCLFSHVEPWLDPNDLLQLWYLEGPPTTVERAARSFDAVPNRYMFVGHYHRWLIATRTGFLPWDVSQKIHLPPDDRYLISVGAVCDGRCALFDTATHDLVPYDFRQGWPRKDKDVAVSPGEAPS